MTRRIKLHPNVPKALRRMYRETPSVTQIAAARGVNPRYVWELLKFGKAPANPKIAHALFVEDETLLKAGDRRRRHMLFWERLDPEQRDQAIDFVFHYREGESMPLSAPPIEDVDPDYGPCCACGRADRSLRIRNIVLLERKTPVPGTGWGCVVCGLSLDGACAIICDCCAKLNAPIRYAVTGFISEKKRILIDQLTGEHHHTLALHLELVIH